MIRLGNFRESLGYLNEAYDLSFNKTEAANIIFWKGIAYEGLGDNRKALTSYNNLINNHVGHYRLPLALLRQGSVFIRLGETQIARLTFEKLIAEYPQTGEAGRARTRLKDL